MFLAASLTNYILIFCNVTGSRYKDLQIQMYGLWGEMRDWEDGTTIVQKTHDCHPDHVR